MPSLIGAMTPLFYHLSPVGEQPFCSVLLNRSSIILALDLIPDGVHDVFAPCIPNHKTKKGNYGLKTQAEALL